MKQDWKPGTMIYPLPAVLVSCGSIPEEYNILTIAWTGTICTNPPMCYISVRPGTYATPIRCTRHIFGSEIDDKLHIPFQDFVGVAFGTY